MATSDATIKKAFSAYNKRLKGVGKKSKMTWKQFKSNYEKTRAKRYSKGRTGVVQKGMSKSLSYREIARFGGK